MVGNAITLVCLHAVVRETHKGDRQIIVVFHTPLPQSHLSWWDPPSAVRKSKGFIGLGMVGLPCLQGSL